MYEFMYMSVDWIPVIGWVAVRSGLTAAAADSDETLYVCLYVCM